MTGEWAKPEEKKYRCPKCLSTDVDVDSGTATDGMYVFCIDCNKCGNSDCDDYADFPEWEINAN